MILLCHNLVLTRSASILSQLSPSWLQHIRGEPLNQFGVSPPRYHQLPSHRLPQLPYDNHTLETKINQYRRQKIFDLLWWAKVPIHERDATVLEIAVQEVWKRDVLSMRGDHAAGFGSLLYDVSNFTGCLMTGSDRFHELFAIDTFTCSSKPMGIRIWIQIATRSMFRFK